MYENEVTAGVEMLDRHFADTGVDWRSRIDLAKLDMQQSKYCILGQLFGDYHLGIAELGIDDMADDHTEWWTIACDHGFNINGEDYMDETYDHYPVLQAEWVKVLSK